MKMASFLPTHLRRDPSCSPQHWTPVSWNKYLFVHLLNPQRAAARSRQTGTPCSPLL